MKNSTLLPVLVLVSCLSTPLIAQNKLSEVHNDLSSFSILIGGKWYLGDSYQVFEWGVGKQSVKAKSYFITDGKPQLVSEGMWFWHPEKKNIKGYFTAVKMPTAFFEYTTKFKENMMLNELTTYSQDGKKETFSEVWEFVGKDSYNWTLYNNAGQVPQKIMNGTFKRKTDNQ